MSNETTAPRVTLEDIEANIIDEVYFSAAHGALMAKRDEALGRGDLITPADALSSSSPLHLVTFCVLVLRNGFTVTGESACVSPENFDEEIGRKVARGAAISKVWPLMGYALKERMWLAGQAGNAFVS